MCLYHNKIVHCNKNTTLQNLWDIAKADIKEPNRVHACIRKQGCVASKDHPSDPDPSSEDLLPPTPGGFSPVSSFVL